VSEAEAVADSAENDAGRMARDQRRYEHVAETLHKAVAWAEDAEARCKALADKIDRCTEHLRVALGYTEGGHDAGLEALAVQVRRARVISPGKADG